MPFAFTLDSTFCPVPQGLRPLFECSAGYGLLFRYFCPSAICICWMTLRFASICAWRFTISFSSYLRQKLGDRVHPMRVLAGSSEATACLQGKLVEKTYSTGRGLVISSVVGALSSVLAALDVFFSPSFRPFLISTAPVRY